MHSVRTPLLLLFAAILLTLSFEPFGQWYLAWAAIAPWLIVVTNSRNARRAMLCGFSGGVAFFAMNLWWLWTASVPGLIVLIAYFSAYWGVAAGAIYSLRLASPADATAPPQRERTTWPPLLENAARILSIAFTWVAVEWLRCHLIEGFPWLPLGTTQTRCVVMCQVADLGGPSIVGFWVMLINGLIAAAWLRRDALRNLAPAATLVAAVLLLVLGYGAFRLTTTSTTPGPRVMVVQSNFRHLRGGVPTATPDEVVMFFLTELESAREAKDVDLAVLPEAAFPPINEEARKELTRAGVGPFLKATNARLAAMAEQSGASLLVGGNAVTGWIADGATRVGSEIRNSAYYFPAHSTGDVQRYDKIHLVPFSERVPFATGPSWLKRWGLAIAARRASQPLTAGTLDTTSPFVLVWRDVDGDELRRLHFITPICLEGVDPRVVARMMRVAQDQKTSVKLIANLSNDGWFAAQEKHQHFQSLAFRSIEHRVPLVRSSNTGISGWIDSTGRVRETVAVDTTGSATVQVELDDRETPYSRYGDLFAGVCMGFAILGATWQFWLWRRYNSRDHSNASSCKS